MTTNLSTMTRYDRSFSIEGVRLDVELIRIKDKDRYISAPQPDWNVVRITAETASFSSILREWNFCEPVDGATLAKSNALNYGRARSLYQQIRYQLGSPKSQIGAK